MKYLFFFLPILIFSTPSFAVACRPDRTNTIRKFIDKLVTEERYFGTIATIEIPRSGSPTRNYRYGQYSFSGLADSYLVHSAFCIRGGECELIDEQQWSISEGCLYLDGALVQVRTSTPTELRFDYVREDGATYRAWYHLLPSRRLNLTLSLRSSAGGIWNRSFSGTEK